MLSIKSAAAALPIILVSVAMAYGQSSPVADAAPDPSEETTPQAATEPVELPPVTQPLALAAQELGVSRCLGTLEQLSASLIGDKGYGANINIDDDHPDERPLQAVLSIDSQTLPPAIAVIDAAPVADGCVPAYTVIRAWQRDCLDIGKTVFDEFEYQEQMPGGVTRLTLGDRLQTLLMPLPSGCLSVRIEVAE